MTAADELRDLEANYFDQPAHAQAADLARINRLRAALGQLPMNARLAPVAPDLPNHPAADVAAAVSRLADAALAYAAYLAKEEALEPHRAYASAVSAATHGGGQTPVRPLATMGTGGGPLVCDHCGKPIPLEGGRYNGVYADRAWASRTGTAPTFADRLADDDNDDRGLDAWKSYVKGGMVVDIETNGTLRIYHGYRGQPGHCLHKADAARATAAARVDPRPRQAMCGPLAAFLKHEFPGMADGERGQLLGRVLDATYGYDPGVGANRPA